MVGDCGKIRLRPAAEDGVRRAATVVTDELAGHGHDGRIRELGQRAEERLDDALRLVALLLRRLFALLDLRLGSLHRVTESDQDLLDHLGMLRASERARRRAYGPGVVERLEEGVERRVGSVALERVNRSAADVARALLLDEAEDERLE